MTPPLLNNISSTGEGSLGSQNPQPTRAVLAPNPIRTHVRHSRLHDFSPVSVQDSGRDNPHYESFLFVKVPETSNNLTHSLIHNIIRKRTQIFAVILHIILYYIDTYTLYHVILFRYRAPGVRKH